MAEYECFKKEAYNFKGKYADYVDNIWEQNKIKADKSCFKRLVDLYAISAIVGLKTGNKAEDDSTGSDHKRTAPLEQMMTNYDILIDIMRLMILFDDSDGSTVEERIQAAFTIDAPVPEETYRKYMKLFNSYMLGGLEYIYNEIVIKPVGPDDHYFGRPGRMFSMLKNLSIETGGM